MDINSLIDEFNAYLILYKKASISTYQAYKHDVQVFIDYIYDNEKKLETLSQKDLDLYFKFLRSKKISNSSEIRSIGALKAFSKFLSQKYGYPNFADNILIKSKFPLACNDEDIKQIINDLENKYYTNKNVLCLQDLRNYLIIYLLYISSININQLVKLEIKHIDFDEKLLTLVKPDSTKIKKILLPLNFFNILKDYVENLSLSTNYLFPVKLGNDIKPISKQAVWSAIRLFLSKTRQNLNIKTDSHIIDDEYFEAYRKLHPRS